MNFKLVLLLLRFFQFLNFFSSQMIKMSNHERKRGNNRKDDGAKIGLD